MNNVKPKPFDGAAQHDEDRKWIDNGCPSSDKFTCKQIVWDDGLGMAGDWTTCGNQLPCVKHIENKDKMKTNEFLQRMNNRDTGPDVARSTTSDDGETVILHCWDGSRYMLTQLPRGARISAKTGKDIPNTTKERLAGFLLSMHAAGMDDHAMETNGDNHLAPSIARMHKLWYNADESTKSMISSLVENNHMSFDVDGKRMSIAEYCLMLADKILG